MNAKEYLKHLQGKFPESSRIRTKTIELRKEVLAARSEQLGDPDLASAGYQFINLTDDEYLMDRIVTPFLRALHPEVSESLSDIPVGTLPLFEINAHALRLPSGEPLVIIDRGLLMASFIFSEAQAASASLVESNRLESAEEYLDETYKLIIRNFLGEGRLSVLKELPPMTYRHYGIVPLLSIGIETFVFAHELAHIYAGHLNECAFQPYNIGLSSNVEADFFVKSINQEFEADSIAWNWYQQCITRYSFMDTNIYEISPYHNLIAPLYLFVLLHILEINLPKRPRYPTHPPARDRLQNLLEKSHPETLCVFNNSRGLEFGRVMLSWLDKIPIYDLKN